MIKQKLHQHILMGIFFFQMQRKLGQLKFELFFNYNPAPDDDDDDDDDGDGDGDGIHMKTKSATDEKSEWSSIRTGLR